VVWGGGGVDLMEQCSLRGGDKRTSDGLMAKRGGCKEMSPPKNPS
jgi:hypothetical protein